MSFTPPFRDLVTMLQRTVAKHPDRPSFGVRKGPTEWSYLTYREFGAAVDAHRAALAGLGVGKGDRVAVISSNRLEWLLGSHAAYSLGAIWVPMYESQLDKDWQYILDDCTPRVCLVGSEAVAARVRAFAPELRLVSLDGELARLAAEAKPVPAVTPAEDDVAMLMYTSGTTGNPKGVRLTHGSICHSVAAIAEAFPMSPEDRTLSFLPWAHVAGGLTEVNIVVANGLSSAICTKVEELLPSLPQVQPTMLVAVPRVWNRIYDGVNANMATKPKVLQRLFHAGLAARAKLRKGQALGLGERLALALAQRLIFKKVLAKFGGKLQFAFSGAAALSPDVAAFIDGLGVNVYEAYGMSETSSVAAVNPRGQSRIGSVGKPLPGVRIELDHSAGGTEADVGEIIFHGKILMAGYHNLPEETAAAFTADHGLRSGDLGRFDSDGYLYITGRVKEIYKLENGKYVSPAPLEEKLTLSPYILQAMVHGMNKPHNVALLVADRAQVEKWAVEQGVTAANLLEHPRVRELMKAEIDRLSADWRGFDKVRDFAVVGEELTVANDMLTPSLKVKRRNVMARYGAELEKLYSSPSSSGSSSRTVSPSQ
jgi:long-chain acyl-CoA synthetase